MAGSVLKPIHVSAKVVLEETLVPALEGMPFPLDQGGSAPPESLAVLEKGIHLHWALPDSLTQGKQLPAKGKVTIFPGVPDLWLVIRFDPLPTGINAFTKRGWRAWVVDSVLGTATKLEAWTPARRHSGEIHTLAGVLKRATSVGYPAWGLWDPERTDFDPAVAAYYPSARKRFGFHDDLADLADRTGTVSYTVIGWFSERGQDPLGLAEDRHGQLNHWKTLHHTRARTYSELGTRVDAKGAADPLDFKVRGLGVLDDLPPSEAQGMAQFRSFSRGGTLDTQLGQMEKLGASFPFPPAEPGAPVQEYAAQVTGLKGPVDTLCHGTVSGVPLSGVKNASKQLADGDVRLFPSIRRALAELAARQADQPDQVAGMEMLLDDLDRQRGTAGGLIDLPGAAHAMTFQGMPGKSQWFARLEIHPTTDLLTLENYLKLSSAILGQDSDSTGFWPHMVTRSASEIDAWMLDPIPPVSRYEPPPAKPQPPTPEEKAAWRVRIRKAFEATAAAAAGAGKPIQPRLLNVVDRRKDAQPSTVGRVIGGGAGTDGASWWVDIGQYDQYDDASPELDELWVAIAGGLVRMPDQDNLYELPGPRWNRPWSPQVVLTGLSRSYRFGYDGRFELDGYTASRPSGEVLNAFSFGSYAPVRGMDLMDQPKALCAVPGLPPEAWSLALESVLLDTENAPLMAYRAAAGREKDADPMLIRKHMTSAVRGLWLRRDRKIREKYPEALASVAAQGVFPSPIAYNPWKNPREPLFLDVSYSQPYSAMADWVLEEDAVELSATGAAAVNPPPELEQVEVMAERCKVTASLTKVLNSALLSKSVSDAIGNQVQAQQPPAGVTADTFVQMDALSAPLTQLDAQLIGRGHRQRAGALRLNRLNVYDKFGTLTHRWQSAINPKSPEGGPELRYWTALPPRLPYWSRLNFRLQAARPSQPGEEANPLRSPVLGVLVPDFLEHALEVFDDEGRAIGQLTTDRPQFGSTEAKTLAVKFALHPWVAAELNLPPDTDAVAAVAAIENPRLRALVAALCEQSLTLPVSAGTDQWFETGLSAMLRCIDTIRATLDPAQRSEDRKARLLGEPILVLGARLSWQGAATDNPSALAADPPLYQAPEELPELVVRIGSATRPDDGVLGCFIEGATPAEGRFAPVSLEAAEKAILNGLALEIPYLTDAAVSHPFVKDQEARFVVPANQNVDVVILADIRGGLYATSGALPRKKIDLPREFIDPAVKNLEPSFRIGPILTTEILGAVKALAPPLDLEGMKTEYVHRKPATDQQPESFPEVPVPSPAPVAELPRERAVLTEGWLRVYRAKQGS